MILKPKRTGRFGNNIYQLYNSVLFAKQIGAEIIDVSEFGIFTMFQDRFGSYTGSTGVTFVNGIKTKDKTIEDKFFNLQNFSGYEFKPDRSISKDVFLDLRNALGIPTVGTTDHLVCHIRAGDIFIRERPKRNYTQPPLAFYLKAIEDCGIKKIKIVYENENNPVVKPLKEIKGVVAQSGKFIDDILSIMEGKTIVCGKGTFVPMVAALGGNATKIVSFREDIIFNNEFYKPIGIKNVVYIDSDSRYIAEDNWGVCVPHTKEAKEHLKMMIEYPKDKIIRLNDEKN